MAQEIFKRYELKYLIDYETYQNFVEEIRPFMKVDAFGNNDGRYSIVSLYFDSEDQRIYYETRNKLQFRQKLRLRIYNDATIDDYAFFEIKQKANKVVNKRRTRMILKDAYSYIENGLGASDLDKIEGISNPQIFKEIHAFKELYNLQPEIIVSYDRQAFQGIYDEDLRITFDYNLMCRSHDLRIEHGPQGQYFLDPNLLVLEVKVSHSVPLWLARLLSKYDCPRKSVSKFCTSIDTNFQEINKRIDL